MPGSLDDGKPDTQISLQISLFMWPFVGCAGIARREHDRPLDEIWWEPCWGKLGNRLRRGPKSVRLGVAARYWNGDEEAT